MRIKSDIKKLLIVDNIQYGYNVSTYNYAKYLREYEITFLCYDSGKKKIVSPNGKVKYLPRYNFRALNYFSFLLNCIFEIRKGYQAVITLWFPFCSLLKLSNNANIILDIRTGFVRFSKNFNQVLNNFICFDSRFFKKFCVISDHLALQLGFAPDSYTVSSVGSPEISFKPRSNNKLNLLYVGTLQNRNIHETIIGLKMALEKMNKNINLKYTVVGDSNSGKEKEDINKLIIKYNMSSFVKLEGYIPRDELEIFFQKNNVGISYIPVVDSYNNQPPTKTFEYLASGMPVIATNNKINKEIITINNGILIDSNATSFCNAVIYISKNLDKYDFKEIYDTSSIYRWKSVVRDNLQPIISEN